MTTSATRDKQGKFARAGGQTVTEHGTYGTPYPCWDDLPEVAEARPLDAYQVPPIAGTEGWDEAFAVIAASYGSARAGIHAEFDRAHYAILRGTPSWEAPDAYAGCGDAAEPPAVLVASRPLGELEAADQERLDAFHAAHDGQASHWRLVHRDPRPTPPGFPAVQGWDGEPQDVPGPDPKTGGLPPAGPGTATQGGEDQGHEPALDQAQPGATP